MIFNNKGATLGKPQPPMPGGLQFINPPRLDGKADVISYDMMIECDGAGPAMQVTWVYSGDIHRDETIGSLAEDLYTQLAALFDET